MPQGDAYQNGQPGGVPQGNPYQNGQPGGAPQGNPYQNLGQGPEEQRNSRKEAWDAQYRQNHWSNQAEAMPPGGAFSGVPQEILEKPQETGLVPYEEPGKPEVQAEAQDILIVDNEQDAGIVLEAAEEALKLEEAGAKEAEKASDSGDEEVKNMEEE